VESFGCDFWHEEPLNGWRKLNSLIFECGLAWWDLVELTFGTSIWGTILLDGDDGWGLEIPTRMGRLAKMLG